MNDEILLELRKQTKWLKFIAFPTLKEKLMAFLDDSKKRRVYNLSDGERSTSEIANLVGVSGMTVSNYWRAWFKEGLVEPSDSFKGRMKRLVDLETIGLGVDRVERGSENE